MNDIAKQATADKFLLVLKKEHLSKKEAGECIGLIPAQVSYLFNKHYWDRLGNVYWDKVLAWVNSGQGLQEYGKKHGKVVVEKQEDTKPKTVDDIMDNVAKSAERHLRRAEKKKTVDLGNGVGKTTTIEEKEQEEAKTPRPSVGQMVDMLIEEKKSLQEKIEAIDVLLKHYIP